VQNLDLALGILDGAGIVTISNAMNWSGGSMSGKRTHADFATATLNLNNPGQVGLITRTLENAGTAFWTGAGGVALTAAAITNRAGALFHAHERSFVRFDFSHSIR